MDDQLVLTFDVEGSSSRRRTMLLSTVISFVKFIKHHYSKRETYTPCSHVKKNYVSFVFWTIRSTLVWLLPFKSKS